MLPAAVLAAVLLLLPDTFLAMAVPFLLADLHPLLVAVLAPLVLPDAFLLLRLWLPGARHSADLFRDSNSGGHLLGSDTSGGRTDLGGTRDGE